MLHKLANMSVVLAKMRGGIDKKRHVSEKKMLRQCRRLEYEKQKGCQQYKSGKRYKKCLTQEQENRIIMALTVVKDHWFESYTAVQCTHIAKDYKTEGHGNEHIPKILIKSSWAQYYYETGVPLIIRWRELQAIFDSIQCTLKDRMILEEMKGVCETIRIMYKEKCILQRLVKGV